MPLTSADASRAMTEVLKKYAVHLPQGLAPRIRALDPARVFRILPADEYRPHFGQYYKSFFAAINAKAFGTEFTIQTAARNQAADICGTFNCPAFCSPAIDNTHRVIYVNQDEPNTFGTLCHEFIHFLEHPNFYPEFYAMGGNNPAILEGVTEYLTRNLNDRVRLDRASQGKYQKWYNELLGSMKAGGHGELDMIRIAFKGEYVNLKGLGGVKPLV